jgi:TolB-like protein
VKTGDCRVEANKYARPEGDLIATNYAATDHLFKHANPALSPRARIVVATLSSSEDLEESTPLGRLISEHISARLVQQGFTVLDPKLQNSLFLVPHEGEFALARELREYGQQQNVDRIVAGTYTVGKDVVYISIKLLNFTTTQVVSAHSYTLPLSHNIDTLLAKSSWF